MGLRDPDGVSLGIPCWELDVGLGSGLFWCDLDRDLDASTFPVLRGVPVVVSLRCSRGVVLALFVLVVVLLGLLPLVWESEGVGCPLPSRGKQFLPSSCVAASVQRLATYRCSPLLVH